MNAATTTLPPVNVRGAANGSTTIGAAIAVPGLCNMAVLGIFASWLHTTLTGQGIRVLDSGALYGRLFAACVIEVTDRNRALRLLESAAVGAPLLPGPIQLAYWDAAEGYWRTVYPRAYRKYFGRLLAEENVAASRDLQHADNGIARAVLLRDGGYT